ncbi:hypothetical protein ACCS88_21200 [Rhizobium ruizarguesonis]
MSKIGQAIIASLAVSFSPGFVWATDFTCTFSNPNDDPFVFYISQIDLKRAKAQFTIVGQKPIVVSATVLNDVLTIFGNHSSDGFQASYLATIAFQSRQPFKVMYSVHSVSKVAQIDLTVPSGFEREGTCVASN